VRKKEIEGWDSLCDVRAWLSADKIANGTHASPSHRAFSRLLFVRNAGGGRVTELREGDREQEEGGGVDEVDGMDGMAGKGRDVDTDKTGGWLESDDIEEW
jgi:hypothetical protein